MTDLDLERLGSVWRQQPDPEELEELRRVAETARRRARWAQGVEVLAAVVVAAVVLFLVVSNPDVDTGLIGGGAILLLLGSQIRQRRLRRIEIESLTGDAEKMLDQSIGRAEARLKRARFSLVALAPALLLGLAFGTLVKQRGGQELFADLLSGPWPRSVLLILVPVALLAAMAFHLLLSIRRGRDELARFTALRDAYRHERESSAAD